MKRPSVGVLVLVLALVILNGWWFLNAMDAAHAAFDRDRYLQDHHEALKQTLAILPVVAGPHPSRLAILVAARRAANDPESFEKGGFTYVGSLGLRFDQHDRLQEVVPSWSPF